MLYWGVHEAGTQEQLPERLSDEMINNMISTHGGPASVR